MKKAALFGDFQKSALFFHQKPEGGRRRARLRFLCVRS